MSKTVCAIRIGIPVLAAAAFCLWLLGQEAPTLLGTCSALLSVSLFALTLTGALVRLSGGEGTQVCPLSKITDTRWDRLSAWGMLLLFGVLLTLAQYVAVYLMADPGIDFAHSFQSLYYRSDVAHYMGIARDWYASEGDERLRLVFFPLYPLLVRTFAVNGDYFAGAFAASQLFSLLCLPAAYELFRLDHDRPQAMAAARFLYLLPGAAFLRVPMSESLFLFLTLVAVYFARKRRFALACLFTALSAFTRSLGILLLLLVFLEMLPAFLERYRQDRPAALRLLPRYLGCLLLGCCGTAAYLAVNHGVSGSPFTFLTYQRENWHQSLGLFFNTASYQAEYGWTYLTSGDIDTFCSLSLPNLLCCFGALGLLCLNRRRLRLSYLLWSLVYFAAAVGATWLLSGPRYLAMVFPLALAMKRLGKSLKGDLILEGSLLLLQTAYLLMLALDLSVY